MASKKYPNALNQDIDFSSILLTVEVILFLLFFYSFAYKDFAESSRSGISLWSCLFQGKIREFYIINEFIPVSDAFGSTSAIYDFPIYIVFAIWNLPNYIYESITGLNSLDNTFFIFWSKSICLPFIIGIMVSIKRILKLYALNIPYSELIMYSLSSIFVFTPITVMGQYDAISLFFMILGVEAYIKEEEKRFCFMFGIATLFKPFALFCFFPLLLIRYKAITKIISDSIRCFSLILICKILQNLLFLKGTVADSILNNHFADFIFESNVPLFYNGTSLFVFAYVVFLLYCYLIQKDSKFGGIYWSLFSLMIFFTTSLTHPQWTLLLWPFCTILIFSTPKKTIGLIIDTIASIGLILAQISYYYWVFSTDTVRHSTLGKALYPATDYNDSVYNLLYELGFPASICDPLILIGGGIFLGAICFFLYWSNQRNAKKIENEWIIDTVLIKHEKIIYLIRILTFTIIGFALIATAIGG